MKNIIIISDNPVTKILAIILLAIILQLIIRLVFRTMLTFQSNHGSNNDRRKDRLKRLKTLNGIARAGSILTVWFVALLTTLSILHVPIAPLLTSAGLVGAAVAFGMQSLIKDFISGVFIIAENQYRVDDYIVLDKVQGWVESITVRTTVIRNAEGGLHHVPNGTIGVTTNLSMGHLLAQEQLDIARDFNVSLLESKLDKISKAIKLDDALLEYVKDGPWLVGISKVNAKSTSVIIAFSTSASKRTKAVDIIWKFILKEKIPLA